jgi:hypothetical protein
VRQFFFHATLDAVDLELHEDYLAFIMLIYFVRVASSSQLECSSKPYTLVLQHASFPIYFFRLNYVASS